MEEILYALVVQKFVEAGVSLVPALSHSIDTSSGRVDQWAEHVEGKLERLHSHEAYEMIDPKRGPPLEITRALQMGKSYA